MCRKQALAEVQALAAVGERNDSPNLLSVSAVSIWKFIIKSLKQDEIWSLEFGPSLKTFLREEPVRSLCVSLILNIGLLDLPLPIPRTLESTIGSKTWFAHGTRHFKIIY